MQAVEIHAVEADLRILVRAVPLPEPLDKFQHDRVPPHPLREAFEIAQRRIGVRVAASSLDVTMHAQGIGPVCLECERTKAFLVDQSPR